MLLTFKAAQDSPLSSEQKNVNR